MTALRAACVIAGTLLMLSLGACAPRGARLPNDALDAAIGRAIGDPTTCVLLADRATSRVVYTYGDPFNCARGLPACDAPGTLSARKALAFAGKPDGRQASCNSDAAGDRSVGWAEGRVKSGKRDLIYSAMMEGQSALPGMEMATRLDSAFSDAGL